MDQRETLWKPDLLTAALGSKACYIERSSLAATLPPKLLPATHPALFASSLPVGTGRQPPSMP